MAAPVAALQAARLLTEGLDGLGGSEGKWVQGLQSGKRRPAGHGG